jgi:hypothetical protein
MVSRYAHSVLDFQESNKDQSVKLQASLGSSLYSRQGSSEGGDSLQGMAASVEGGMERYGMRHVTSTTSALFLSFHPTSLKRQYTPHVEGFQAPHRRRPCRLHLSIVKGTTPWASFGSGAPLSEGIREKCVACLQSSARVARFG